MARIRTKVFVQEQGVPEALEIDGMDESSYHFVACTQDGRVIGTARLLSSGQIGRMAVLKDYRNLGIGAQLLELAICKAKKLNLEEIFLHAQIEAFRFYRRHGFEPYGEEYEEAGIRHRSMRYARIHPHSEDD